MCVVAWFGLVLGLGTWLCLALMALTLPWRCTVARFALRLGARVGWWRDASFRQAWGGLCLPWSLLEFPAFFLLHGSLSCGGVATIPFLRTLFPAHRGISGARVKSPSSSCRGPCSSCMAAPARAHSLAHHWLRRQPQPCRIKLELGPTSSLHFLRSSLSSNGGRSSNRTHCCTAFTEAMGFLLATNHPMANVAHRQLYCLLPMDLVDSAQELWSFFLKRCEVPGRDSLPLARPCQVPPGAKPWRPYPGTCHLNHAVVTTDHGERKKELRPWA